MLMSFLRTTECFLKLRKNTHIKTKTKWFGYLHLYLKTSSGQDLQVGFCSKTRKRQFTADFLQLQV